MAIGYDVKNGIKYAKICKGERCGKTVTSKQICLGRVIDEDKKIYHNRKRGYFTYDDETDEYSSVDLSLVPIIKRKNSKEKLILDFGDTFFLDNYIKDLNLYESIEELKYGNKDSVKALLFFYLLTNYANCYAQEWLDGNYAKILFPKANLNSEIISDILDSIGTENSYRSFFTKYFKTIVSDKEEDILIDSTGLPNNIHFPLTAISNHNGEIENEIRLIYVVQRYTNLPLFFRYVPGNILDVSTLKTTIKELKRYKIDTKFAILDAGYLTEENIKELNEEGISYISRLPENRVLYKEIIKEYLTEIDKEENLVKYNDRYVYVKKLYVSINDKKEETIEESNLNKSVKFYVYLCRDVMKKTIEISSVMKHSIKENLPTSEVHKKIINDGVFILYSSRKIKSEDVLSTYYTRQQIEQVFDIVKNNTKMLPLRIRKEETLRGHLMLSFISAIIVKQLQKKLKETDINPCGIFLSLRNLKCKVFDNYILPQEVNASLNKLLKCFDYKITSEIDIKTLCC